MDNKLAHFLFTKAQVPQYRTFLNLSSVRQKLTSSNVANVSTPGYEARDIDFDKEFARATGDSRHLAGKITNVRHIPLGEHTERAPEVEITRVQSGDMNSVDIDQEMTRMAENELRYTVAARLLAKKFQGLRNAITSK